MNARSDFFAAAAPLALAQAFVAPLGPSAAAVVFDAPAGAGRDRARLSARVAGLEPARGFVAARLELRGGGCRRVLFISRCAAEIEARGVVLDLDGLPAAAIDPSWLQPPRIEPDALLDGLAASGLRRLVRLGLTTAASALGPVAAPRLGALARRALERLGAPALPALAWTPIGASGGVMTWRAPDGVDPDGLGALALTAPAGPLARRLAPPRLETAGAARLIHLHLPATPPPGAAAIGLGPRPATLLPPPDGAAPRPFAAWLAKRDPATRAWALGLVEAAAATDPAAAAIARELRHAASPAPRLRLRALAGTPEGLLYALALDDPHGLVAAVRIERGDGATDVAARPGAIAGHVALARRSAIEDRCRLSLVHRSGRVRAAFAGAVPPFRGPAPAGLSADAAPALAAARLAMERPACRAATESFGPRPRRVALSLVAPLGPDLDLVRARAALAAAEPGAATLEIVCHAAAGPAAEAARAALAHAAAVFGVAHRLVTLDPDADATDRLLAALAAAEGPALLLTGAAVLPAGSGWLSPWRRLGPRRPLVAGLLLDHDGAVLDAGAPGQWLGLPSRDLPARAAARATRVSAACAGLTREAAERLAAGPRHPNPDVMLTALAARLAEEGRPASLRLASRFVRFDAADPTPLDAAADALAAAALVKASFSLPGAEHGACRP